MSRTTVVLLCGGVCVLFAAWFFTAYEKVVVEQPAAYQGEARINDFLAAEMLLNELGIDADSRSSLTPSNWLPETNDTIFVRLTAAFAVDAERELLSTWIADGGHLILMPPDQESRLTDDFLNYLGFRLVEIDEDDDTADEKQDDEQDEDDSYAYIVDLDGTRYRVEMTEEQTDGATLTDEQGIIAARLAWATGYVTVVANSSYFTNQAIDDSDHARLLLDTVAGHVEPGKVWLIYNAAFPALWQVIWKNASYVVVGLATMLVLWLWSVMPTFGPKIQPEPSARRSIIEHIKAAGHFVWRHDAAAVLTASSTAAVMHEAESRHPGISRLSAEKQATLIARMTGQSVQVVFDILTNRDERRPREFTHNMQLLQTLRKQL